MIGELSGLIIVVENALRIQRRGEMKLEQGPAFNTSVFAAAKDSNPKTDFRTVFSTRAAAGETTNRRPFQYFATSTSTFTGSR